jgi:hypothetical protein
MYKYLENDQNLQNKSAINISISNTYIRNLTNKYTSCNYGAPTNEHLLGNTSRML